MQFSQCSKISVVGGGSWGTALACLVAKNGINVHLWVRRSRLADAINNSHENAEYLPGVQLPERLTASPNLEQAVSGAEMVIVAVPSGFISDILPLLSKHLQDGTVLVCATKGFDEEHLSLMSELFAKYPGNFPFVYLGGPSFAAEVGRSRPTAVTVASTDTISAVRVQKALTSRFFRVYLSTDLIGLQLGGAMKNVIAIAAGISDGLGFGYNARAALITRGLAEIVRLGEAMGAKKETFYGLAGIGDLLLTATGNLSRNRTIGFNIGRGAKLQDLLSEMKMVAEGVKTARSAWLLSKSFNLYMPITRETYLILYKQKEPLSAVNDLMQTVPGHEEHCFE